ncbi:MAG: hypothetical protein HZB18_02535 [Chloroflexi bacterium]|nr:hypothetical protein [Chloroflexota bacterium]
MPPFTSESFLDQLIYNQRRSIQYYLFFTIGLILLGGVVIVFAFLSPALFASANIAPDVFKIAGAFVSSLGGFQVREILDRKEKIQTFETFKGHLAGLKKSPKSERTKTEKQFEELMWKYIEKATLS